MASIIPVGPHGPYEFGFLSQLVEIHFPGPSGITGPTGKQYEGYYVYPPLQDQVYAVSQGVVPGPGQSAVFQGYKIQNEIPQVGWPSLDHVGAGYAIGPFTAAYASTFAAALNALQAGAIACATSYFATSSSPGEPFIPPGAEYSPTLIVPPVGTTSKYPVGSFANYDGSSIFSVGPVPFAIVPINGDAGNIGPYLAPAGPTPLYTVGGPTEYFGLPPYDGG